MRCPFKYIRMDGLPSGAFTLCVSCSVLMPRLRCFYILFAFQIVKRLEIAYYLLLAFEPKGYYLLLSHPIRRLTKTCSSASSGRQSHIFLIPRTGITHFPFKWLPFIIPSPWVTVSDFSAEEKGHVVVLNKLSSDIIALNLEGTKCIEIIQHIEDPAALQQRFSEFFAYWLCFHSLGLLMLVTSFVFLCSYYLGERWQSNGQSADQASFWRSHDPEEEKVQRCKGSWRGWGY